MSETSLVLMQAAKHSPASTREGATGLITQQCGLKVVAAASFEAQNGVNFMIPADQEQLWACTVVTTGCQAL